MKRTIVAVVVLLLVYSAGYAKAAVPVVDINFNSDAIGSTPATGAMAPLITQPGAFGGYTSTAWNSPPTADNGTVLVQNVGGLSNAAVLTTNPSNVVTGALYMDTEFSITSSQQVTLGFDIDVINAPSRLVDPVNSQIMSINGDPSNSAGILFGARIYDSTNSQWAFSVAVVPTSATGGVFALRNADNTDLTTFGSYLNGQANQITVVGDYATGTASAYLNGTLGLSGYALRGGIDPAPNFSELFMYENGENNGLGNSVAIDNVEVDAGNAIPEPSTLIVWSLLGTLAIGLGWWRKRKAA